MKVRDVLELEPMSEASVLAGAAGLEREVTGVNIIEVPDVERWLKGGEFLFTAGYAWRETPEALSELLCDLDRVGVSGVGVKLGPYLPSIPREVVEVANDRSLPLIRIPPTLAYMDVIDPIYRQLAARRLWILERTSDIHDVLTSLGLDDQSIESVAGELAQQLHGSVYVFDDVDDSVVVAESSGETHRMPGESVHPDVRAVALKTPSRLNDRRPTVVSVGGAHGLAASLVVGRRQRGRVVVLHDGGELAEFAERSVHHVAELISFLLMKRMAVIEGRREAGQLFLHSLMSDSLSREEASERALTVGLHLSSPHVVLVVGAVRARESDVEALSIAAERALADRPHVVGAMPDGKQLFALVEVSAGEEAWLVAAAGRLEASSAAGGVPDVVIGSGSALPGLEGVRRSRSEATIAFNTTRRLGGRAGLVRFEDLGVERLLAQIPRSPLIAEYVERTLGPILQDAQLMRTLEAFLEHGGNKVAAAAAVPLHRSSLMYRLDKISKLLGVDLDEPERFLELWLAVRLRRILA